MFSRIISEQDVLGPAIDYPERQLTLSTNFASTLSLIVRRALSGKHPADVQSAFQALDELDSKTTASFQDKAPPSPSKSYST
jgi:hypothetical protein